MHDIMAFEWQENWSMCEKFRVEAKAKVGGTQLSLNFIVEFPLFPDSKSKFMAGKMATMRIQRQRC